MEEPARLTVRMRVLDIAGLERYVVMLDGGELAKIAGRAEKTFLIPPGHHVLYVTNRKSSSERARFDVGPGRSRTFECGVSAVHVAATLVLIACFVSVKTLERSRGADRALIYALLGVGAAALAVILAKSWTGAMTLREVARPDLDVR